MESVSRHIVLTIMGARRQDKPELRIPEGERASLGAMDPEEFAAHYRRAYPRLHLVAASIIGDRTHAHDIVQEAAVIALQKADRFIEGASYIAWLSEIVRRCSLNYVNKVRGRRTHVADPELFAQTQKDDSTCVDALPINSATGELVDLQRDLDDAMVHALNEIHTDARCCFLLRVVQNLTYAEISELMQIPEGTAMSHVHRTKRQLKRLLESNTAHVEGTSENL
jgi:RNA polymerase sigma-70 factor (ECF subfamily)